MKKKIISAISILLIALVIIFGIIMVVALLPTPYKDYTWQTVGKCDYVSKVKEKKYFYVSGSSGLYGVDPFFLSDLIDCRVYNMSRTAGQETVFVTNMAFKNANPGDTILIGYEYDNWRKINVGARTGDISYAAMCVDADVEMMRYLCGKDVIELFKFLPMYCFKKIDFLKGYDNIDTEKINTYEIDNEEMYRDFFTVDYPEYTRMSGTVISNPRRLKLTPEDVSVELMDFIRAVNEKAKRRDVEVLLVACPMLEGADEEMLDDTMEYISEYTGCPWISSAEEHVFSLCDMCDTEYHCNSKGCLKNTLQLANDIENYEKSKNKRKER